MKNPITISILAIIALQACAPSEPVEEITSAEPPKRDVAFKGEIDPKFVGTWKESKNALFYTFDKAGTYAYKGTVNTQAGPQKIDISGEWLVDGDRLVLRPKGDDATDLTYKMDGKSLSLKTNGLVKLEFKYNKQ